MDNKFSTLEIAHQVVNHITESRFVFEELVTDAVDLQRTFIDLTIRLQVLMVVVAGKTTVDLFTTADFNDAVTLAGLQACCFCIEYDLA